MEEVYLKNLIPNGDGEWTVHRFALNTVEAANALRDLLIGLGDWQEADAEDWNQWTAAVPEIASALAAAKS